MANKTLAALTAATPATGGLLYGTQGGADRKFTVTAAGAALMEATSAPKLDELSAGTSGSTALDATTSKHGLMSHADKAKLDGISSGAPCTGVAFIETTGSDDTAVIGDATKPFATMQAAYNAGSRVFSLGVGGFAGFTGTTLDVMILGKGMDVSNVTSQISGTGGSVWGNGETNISLYTISIIGETGADGIAPSSTGDPAANGADGGSPQGSFKGFTASSIYVRGGTGGAGGPGGVLGSPTAFAGGTGGAGGSPNYECTMINVPSVQISGAYGGVGGDGGYGADHGGNGGAGGNGGSAQLTAVNCRGDTWTCSEMSGSNPGNGGTGTISDGGDGSYGASGTSYISITQSWFLNDPVAMNSSVRASFVTDTWRN